MPATATATTTRVDCVFIRKSTQAQGDEGQRANVEAMLRDAGVYVPDRYWFVGTVSRRKVRDNPGFNALMELVQAGKVGTVYVESQDRWGTADRRELYSLLGVLCDNRTRLYDLRAKKDLTDRDLATEMMAFVNSIKSEKELQDISYRSLRTRVGNFKATGTWPTGPGPFGYGKACLGPDGKLKWEWHPTSRTLGQVFHAAADGRLMPGAKNVKIPRKAREDRIKLVPHNDPDYVRAVRLVFDQFTRVGLSRRMVSKSLNDAGLRAYGRPWTHGLVTSVLRNPVYVGDTHFGKEQSGDLHTFDGDGLIVPAADKRRRPAIVKTDTHEALIDRPTFALAQEKLDGEAEAHREGRKNFSPRNPAYWLKQIFRCGHCGKGLQGRTEKDWKTGKRTVVYVCCSYIQGRCNGHKATCGYQRITHADAERLLLDKARQMGLEFDMLASAGARANLQERLARLGHEDEEARDQWCGWLCQGLDALGDYLRESCEFEEETIRSLEGAAGLFYKWGVCDPAHSWPRPRGRRPPADEHPAVTPADLKRIIMDAEHAAAERAERKLAKLQAKHDRYTGEWVDATDLMRSKIKAKIVELEDEIERWKPRTVPLSERFQVLYAAEEQREAERKKLLAEWPTLDAREKGEAIRRLFRRVTLFWERKFHPPATRPTRPSKTDRKGRYTYHLQHDRIRWEFATSDLAGSW
ncbi:MAG TPA: recombinase family protein [Gemmataceae bacterium]|jgi:hypothetical protein